MKTEEIIEKTIEIVETMCSKEGVEKFEKVLEHIGSDNYFTAPASSRQEYHNCFPGGLAEHNLNVLYALIELNEGFNFDFNSEDICLAALFHDLGKAVNVDLKPFYVPTTEKWKIDRGEDYQHDYGSIYFPTNQRSVYLLMAAGVNVSPRIYQAILLNDGPYLEGNKAYNHKADQFSIALHSADHLATLKEKTAKTS